MTGKIASRGFTFSSFDYCERHYVRLIYMDFQWTIGSNTDSYT